MKYALSYLDNGTLQTATRSVNDDVGQVTDYTWRNDGQISGIEKTFTDRVETVSLATAYSAEGILQSATYRHGGQPDFRTTNYTAHYSYDPQGRIESGGYDPLSTGNVQARAQYEWEAGACYPIHSLTVGEMAVAHNALTESATFPAGVFSKSNGSIHDTE